MRAYLVYCPLAIPGMERRSVIIFPTSVGLIFSKGVPNSFCTRDTQDMALWTLSAKVDFRTVLLTSLRFAPTAMISSPLMGFPSGRV